MNIYRALFLGFPFHIFKKYIMSLLVQHTIWCTSLSLRLLPPLSCAASRTFVPSQSLLTGIFSLSLSVGYFLCLQSRNLSPCVNNNSCGPLDICTIYLIIFCLHPVPLFLHFITYISCRLLPSAFPLWLCLPLNMYS